MPTDHEIETFSGKYLDLSDPRAEDITLEDIAHGLSNTCRYNGQTASFYSVAEHAVAVSNLLERQGHSRLICLAGLHHDDPEAFLGDVTRPLKTLLEPAYGELTEKMDAAVIEALKLPFDPWLFACFPIKTADNIVLLREAQDLMPSRGYGWAGTGCNWELSQKDATLARALDWWAPECQPPVEAEGLYLSRHWSLV